MITGLISICMLPEARAMAVLSIALIQLLGKQSAIKSIRTELTAITSYCLILYTLACFEAMFNDELSIFKVTASLIASIFPIAFFFIRRNKRNNRILKNSIILASLIISIRSIGSLLTSGLVSAQVLKGSIGSQRYGLIMIFAMLLSLDAAIQVKSCKGIVNRIKNYNYLIIMVISTIGLLLTFSRTAYLASAAGTLVYLMSKLKDKKLTKKPLKIPAWEIRRWAVCGIILTIFYVLYMNLGISFGSWFDTFNINNFDFSNKLTSEGYRLAAFARWFEYLKGTPFVGTMLLGCYKITGESECSYHSQYFDTLLRFGVIGFGIVLVLAWKILRRVNIKTMPVELASLSALTIYSIFHETIRIPQMGIATCIILWRIIYKNEVENNKIKVMNKLQ